MMHKLDNLVRAAKWALNIPMIILCIEEFQKALRSLRTYDEVKKNVVSKINFLLGVMFAVAYIPNLYLRQPKSFMFLVAAWLCLHSVSNGMSRILKEYARMGESTFNR